MRILHADIYTATLPQPIRAAIAPKKKESFYLLVNKTVSLGECPAKFAEEILAYAPTPKRGDMRKGLWYVLLNGEWNLAKSAIDPRDAIVSKLQVL